MSRERDDMIEVTYKCSKCEATDTARLFPSEPVPVAINCWKCHAGFRTDIGEMIAHRVGMFPLAKGRAA